MFLTRTPCHKTTHANGYYGAWLGWAVSVGMLPLTSVYYSLFSHSPIEDTFCLFLFLPITNKAAVVLM